MFILRTRRAKHVNEMEIIFLNVMFLIVEQKLILYDIIYEITFYRGSIIGFRKRHSLPINKSIEQLT